MEKKERWHNLCSCFRAQKDKTSVSKIFQIEHAKPLKHECFFLFHTHIYTHTPTLTNSLVTYISTLQITAWIMALTNHHTHLSPARQSRVSGVLVAMQGGRSRIRLVIFCCSLYLKSMGTGGRPFWHPADPCTVMGDRKIFQNTHSSLCNISAHKF